MEIKIEQLKTFAPDITQALNNLLVQLNPNSKKLTDEEVKEIIEETSSHLLIAKEPKDNKIVGMLTLITFSAPSAKKGVLEDVVVDDNFQGKGIGKKLITQAINMAREAGVARLEFTSNPERVKANKFYQHLGFNKRDTNVYRMEI
ncbi:MAG: streptothricin acetyltransferase [Candidatus Levybacteria bacterium]|nr:streptothricin acetyltransferase [Candidatus Levybacteria bacterium]